MERNKRDLEAEVISQKEQLGRYEKRLKDVVTAYKGLLKEKEALEMSLAVTVNPVNSSTINENVAVSNSNPTSISATSIDLKETEDKSQMQTQILTLMNSLATLSAEKSRMEASFQADKKQLRTQLTQKDQTIAELQMKIREVEERAKASIDDVKAKWIIERQEREKESNNQIIMIRELQKLYADERHLKESIEMQLNNFKTQFASDEAENTRVRELQAELKEAKTLIKELEGSNKLEYNAADADNAAALKQVQEEMRQLKDQHAVAIKLEKQRVQQAEEQIRNQAVLHEERVASLEDRLAELSTVVGTNDRYRQRDQENIQALKKKIYELESSVDIRTEGNEELLRRRSFMKSTQDVGSIVDEIIRLKKLLIQQNSQSKNPIDVSKIFEVGADHTECQEEIKRAEKYYEDVKNEISKLRDLNHMQKIHLMSLQHKIEILNRNIEELENELKNQTRKHRQAMKEERTKSKNTCTEIENESRSRINELEQQLQSQRQRSLQLLEEKEQEIKTLNTSFEVFAGTVLIAPESRALTSTTNKNGEQLATSSDNESTDGVAANSKPTPSLKSKKLSVGENCHMLHYANEIARKEIEITGLRKAKNAAEAYLRKVIQDKIEFCERIHGLEEQVDCLQRCKTREGANLEYLKNVIISFLSTKDADGRRHMLNAIAAVLQFTSTEVETINATSQKK